MNNFIKELFKVESIEHSKLETLEETLEIIEDDYLEKLTESYEIDVSIIRNEKIRRLNSKIKEDFKSNLMNFTSEEHKSFNEFYNGIVDYSDENVYVNLKKFTALGIIFLFTTNGGKLYIFKIPDELCEIYEELIRTS
ncbi:hypothetical protein [Anaerosphaera multitolerans]|uniref:Uncharacterized protein n=1 Tax=Anaerosphaera multitolerans TaxID=2487351 RepID=A0A437S929_9FIRM|nr:hypothetical protein [Anaerosphaera multitolerans]RVU55609.1 hypothetical protein EF514_02445 [Anaerosphaera multitolerans]